MDNALFLEIGREEGCLRIAREFYARVATNPELRVLFPGKSFRCATEELAAFLVQFFDGDEEKTQYRWWLSLRESHARFQISEAQRMAWLGHMNATLEALDCPFLFPFFESASDYIVHSSPSSSDDPLWSRQLSLDQLIAAIVGGRDAEAIALSESHYSRRSVMVGIFARMMETLRAPLIQFVLESLSRDPGLAQSRFNGRYLLHFAAASGCLPVVDALLSGGNDPNVLDQGGHAPLYRVANGCGSSVGAEIVFELVRRGALVDHDGGVTRSTALHAAARQGHLPVAMALLESGASQEVRDSKGFTPLDRARNCRKWELIAALGGD